MKQITDEQIYEALCQCDIPMQKGVVRATIPDIRALFLHLRAALAATQQGAPSQGADAVLAALDELGDDAAVHIWPDDLDKCSRTECTAVVYSVRMVSPDGKTVPLFSRKQVAAALLEASTKREKQWIDLTDDEVRAVIGISDYGPSQSWLVMQDARAVEAKLREKNATQREQPAANRTHVDSGALTMALNVLRRAGKAEVADALEETAVRGEQPAAKPDLFLEMRLDQPAFPEVNK